MRCLTVTACKAPRHAYSGSGTFFQFSTPVPVNSALSSVKSSDSWHGWRQITIEVTASTDGVPNVYGASRDDLHGMIDAYIKVRKKIATHFCVFRATKMEGLDSRFAYAADYVHCILSGSHRRGRHWQGRSRGVLLSVCVLCSHEANVLLPCCDRHVSSAQILVMKEMQNMKINTFMPPRYFVYCIYAFMESYTLVMHTFLSPWRAYTCYFIYSSIAVLLRGVK